MKTMNERQQRKNKNIDESKGKNEEGKYKEQKYFVPLPVEGVADASKQQAGKQEEEQTQLLVHTEWDHKNQRKITGKPKHEAPSR